MSLLQAHLERDRAESFGSAAEDYDRHRPGLRVRVVTHAGFARLDA